MFSLLKRYATLPALFALVAPTFAQTMGTGTITGTVTDATGAVVPGVKITATNSSTGIERNVGHQRQRRLCHSRDADWNVR